MLCVCKSMSESHISDQARSLANALWLTVDWRRWENRGGGWQHRRVAALQNPHDRSDRETFRLTATIGKIWRSPGLVSLLFVID